MKPLWKFRVAAFVIALTVGSVAVTNLIAELLRPPASAFPATGTKIPSQTQVDTAKWVTRITPLRTDLKSDFALTIAAQALRGETSYYKPGIIQDAQDAAKRALLAGPHDSRIWLVLALLRSQRNPRDPQVAEPLKMSYFTGPNLLQVVPTRLQLVATSTELGDLDLQELARGDMRLILTRRPDLRSAITDAYRRGSPAGKIFIEDSAKTIDPKFAASLPIGR